MKKLEISLFKNIPKKRIILDGIGIIIWSALNLVYLKILSTLIDNYANKNPAIPIIFGYFIFLILWEIVEYICDTNKEVTYTIIENNVRRQAIEETNKLKPEVIKKYNTGYINGLVDRYVMHKLNLYNFLIIYAPLSTVYIIYAIIQMWSYHFLYGFSLLVLILLSFIIKMILTSVKESKKLTELESERSKVVIDTISNINTVQKMQCKDFVLDKLTELNNDCVKQTKRWTRKNETSFTLYKFFLYSYLPISLFIYHFIPINDSAEFFSLLSIICVQLVHTAQSIAQTLVCGIKYKATLDKLKEIYNDSNIRQDIFESKDFYNAKLIDITYKYINEETNKTITIEIPHFELYKGDKICLYGESGQGKSTLLNILSGEIETNKVIINNKLENKRLECVFISQDTEILDMSLRDNLTLGKNIEDSEIINLLDRCGLGDWYYKQPKGLDTILGERGVFVSTGQRQRLNIIRGLLVKDKEVYLLDEPTSNVDDITEEKIIKVIEEYLKNKTVVIVTHRPKIKNICTKAYKFTDSILGKEEKLFIN